MEKRITTLKKDHKSEGNQNSQQKIEVIDDNEGKAFSSIEFEIQALKKKIFKKGNFL